MYYSSVRVYGMIIRGKLGVGLDRLCSQNHEKLLFLKPKSC